MNGRRVSTGWQCGSACQTALCHWGLAALGWRCALPDETIDPSRQHKQYAPQAGHGQDSIACRS